VPFKECCGLTSAQVAKVLEFAEEEIEDFDHSNPPNYVLRGTWVKGAAVLSKEFHESVTNAQLADVWSKMIKPSLIAESDEEYR